VSRPDLLHGPIVPTLLRMALPNVFAMAAATAVGIGETLYVGLLGKTSLAAMALVFPLVMLMQMFSAGAMGGGVSSAISRALGANQPERARALAVHATCMGAALGLGFTLLLWFAGPALYRVLGGSGAVLEQAVGYGLWVFAATPAIWLFNTLISLVRGGGNMRLPSAAILAGSLVQITLGASLGLGLLGAPRLGMTGVALGQVIAWWAAAGLLWWYVRRGPSRIRLDWRGVRLEWPLFQDILRVGALACLSPLLSVGTVLVVTGLVARTATTPWPATRSARAWSSCWCPSPSGSASAPCRWWAWRSAPATCAAPGAWPGLRAPLRRCCWGPSACCWRWCRTSGSPGSAATRRCWSTPAATCAGPVRPSASSAWG
jgi:Na+-driven multidrug efflux pump